VSDIAYPNAKIERLLVNSSKPYKLFMTQRKGINVADGSGSRLHPTHEGLYHLVPTSAFSTPVQRPYNSRLNTSKLQSVFGLTLPTWQQSVDRMLLEVLA
jgi:dTDP-4-dehydrorhamnose reductase